MRTTTTTRTSKTSLIVPILLFLNRIHSIECSFRRSSNTNRRRFLDEHSWTQHHLVVSRNKNKNNHKKSDESNHDVSSQFPPIGRGGALRPTTTATTLLFGRFRSLLPGRLLFRGRKRRSRRNTTLSPMNDNDNVNNNNKGTTIIQPYNPLRMYLSCMGIVLAWITTGTLFYSYYNEWPLPQSFFYAVDAGMSIGFCTQVYETKLVSKAFTIIFILLGASVIGGALALFIQDALESLSTPSVDEYQLLLEKEAFDKADVDHTGVLTYEQFLKLIETNFEDVSQEDIQRLWTKFDRLHDGVIHFECFVGTFRGIDRIIQSLHSQQSTLNPLQRALAQFKIWLQQAWQLEHRIYVVFLLWMLLGISWGMLDQGWDPITATHFAVSALATGGLTAPSVNDDGILPTDPAIFCGVYCLLGIPLFALTLGHFARVLVADHIAALERSALARPMTKEEFELASHLTTKDSVVHLSDFIVLQLLRQGKLTVEGMEVLKQNFDLLDTDHSGVLTLEQATSPPLSMIHPPTDNTSPKETKIE